MPIKYAYLENTTGGHNKFYEMCENPGGKTFKAKWGRIGGSSQEKDYSIGDWYNKFDEKIKKGYVNLTHTKNPPASPKKTFETNKEHLKKVNQVYSVLNLNADNIDGSKELIRDVGAIRKSIKDPDSMLNGSLSKDDMVYLNNLWKKIRHLTKKD